ncbi:MAG TPA: bifunctional diguanylate cyclase/phosphodiesterase [Acidimicrobiales bacterium]|nr:bifunctional diguanylate cyclase/phosphodiesterase [Acidimicrobiales bacterium]
MTASALPGRVRTFVGAVLAAAVALVVAGVVGVDGGAAPEPWRVVLAAGVFFLGEHALFEVRVGHDHRAFTWAETACVVALAAVGWPWALLVCPPAVAVAHLIRRRPLVKIAFNAGSCTIGLAVARLVATALGVGTDRQVLARPSTWLGLAAGATCYFLVTTLLVSLAVAWSQGVRVVDIHRRDLALNALVGAGNIAAGVLVVATAVVQPALLIPFPLLLGLLWLLYRNYLKATQDRDTWEALLMASRDLLEVDGAGLVSLVLERTAAIFAAEAVDVLVVHDGVGEHAVWTHDDPEVRRAKGDPFIVAGTFWGRALSDREPFDLQVDDAPVATRAEMVEAGLASCLVAPLLVHGECSGTLRIGFRGRVRFGRRERQVFSMFANNVSAALRNARLFDGMRDMALHDHLTGLPNRTVLLDRLESARERSGRDGTKVGVLFMDLDRFKVINDSLGHDIGDQLLVAAGRRICSVLRDEDLATRFGGDDFVVVCEGLVDEANAVEVADRIADALRAPFFLSGQDVFVTASVGVAVAEGDDWLPVTLIRDADAAMYRAKDGGRAKTELFDHDMRAGIVDRLEIESDLRHAIGRGQLRLHYQPTVRTTDQVITGVEALVRWQHPTRGLVPPMEFIGVAEETGYIREIGAWVLDEACRQLAEWRRSPGLLDPSFQMAVNVSTHQMSNPGLVAEVRATLDQHGVPANALCLEITESALLHDTVEVRSNIEGLRKQGIHLALDDFGTGYSALSYLHRLPVEVLKIDRSFIADIAEGAKELAIVTGTVELAHAIGMRVVAEGVETAAQLSQLRSIGCDTVQGWYIARPATADDVLEMLSLLPVA